MALMSRVAVPACGSKTCFVFCAETRRLCVTFENTSMSSQKKCFVCEAVDDHWTAKCPSLQCPICGETYTFHTAATCPKLTQKESSESSVKALEVNSKSKSIQKQKLIDIHEELKSLQKKLQEASELENLLLELSCGQNPKYLETIWNVDVKYKAVNRLEYNLQNELDKSVDPTDQSFHEYSKKTQELKTSTAFLLSKSFGNSLSTHILELAEEDKNFISFYSGSRIYIRIRILEIQGKQKVLIVKHEELPYELKFKDMKVYDLFSNNETFIEVILREEIDFTLSDMVKKLRGKTPIMTEIID